MTVWPSGLRRWLQAPVRKGVGSNPTAVICYMSELLDSHTSLCFRDIRFLQPSIWSMLLCRRPQWIQQCFGEQTWTVFGVVSAVHHW